jgi:hypothetical protein
MNSMEKTIYKPIKSTINSRPVILSSYSELVEKYYKVLSIETEQTTTRDTIYWIKLIGDDNNSFFCKIEKYNGSNNFVTLGYYEKMKQTFVGKDFYSQGTLEREKVDSKETVKFPPKTKFKCIDIAIKIGEDEPTFAVLENEKYGKIKGEIIKGQRLHMFISVSACNEYIKKYGTKFGNCVAERKIIIGMNKKMVRDAWGVPDNINTTTGSYGTHEQWVYDSRYIYFKNGIVTSIQY